MSRDFNGSTQSVEPTSNITPSGTSYTFGCKFKADSVTGSQALFAQRRLSVGNSLRFELTLEGDTTRCIIKSDANVTIVMQSGASSIGTTLKRSVIVVRNGDAGELFLDGASVATDNQAVGTITDDANSCLIGAHYLQTSTRADHFDGTIGEVVFWDTNLTAAEVSAWDKGANPYQIRSDKLLFYMPLYGEADPEVDLSGIGNNSVTLHASPAKGAEHFTVGRLAPQSLGDVTGRKFNACLNDFVITE